MTSLILARILQAIAILEALAAPFWPRLAFAAIATALCSLSITGGLVSLATSWIWDLLKHRFNGAHDADAHSKVTSAYRH